MTTPEAESHSPDQGSIGKGFLIGFLLDLLLGLPLLFVLGAISSELWAVGLAACGLTQLVYQVPAAIVAAVKGRPKTMRGIILVTSLLFLLNAGCWGLAMAEFSAH